MYLFLRQLDKFDNMTELVRKFYVCCNGDKLLEANKYGVIQF